MQKWVFDTLPSSPFARLRALLDDVTPRLAPVSLALGEPQHAPPDFVLEALKRNLDDYGRYPPIGGTPDWQAAVRTWLARRFGVESALADNTQVLPLNGTREGLFLAAQIAPPKNSGLIAMPDPFYQIYASAAVAAGAQPHYLAATRDNGFIAPLDDLSEDALARLRALYLCNPANPQGAVADKAYLEQALELAQRHHFLLMVDECYTEIYDPNGGPPPSILQIMQENNLPDAPVLAFHSLSKRSNLPGLRSGFVAGGKAPCGRFPICVKLPARNLRCRLKPPRLWPGVMTRILPTIAASMPKNLTLPRPYLPMPMISNVRRQGFFSGSMSPMARPRRRIYGANKGCGFCRGLIFRPLKMRRMPRPIFALRWSPIWRKHNRLCSV